MDLRLHLDEDATLRALIRTLTARGLDVSNAIDAGLAGLSDEKQLEYSTEAGRILYSYNIGDYYRLHSDWLRAGRSHAGLILVPQQRYSVGEQMRRILRINHRLNADDFRNRVEFLARWD